MPSDEVRRWAESGAMALTGRPDGPPRVAPGRPASTIADLLGRIARARPQAVLPDVRLLGERAAAAGFRRNAPWSCGGSFRVVPSLEGRLAVSLARPSDLDLVPALTCGAPGADAWAAISAWARELPAAECAARARELGLPVAPVGAAGPSPPRPGVLVRHGAGRRHRRDRPLVVDFTALWAGPLCAHLLSRCGADIVKVESVSRLDGARSGPIGFFDLLHHGHRSVTVDPTTTTGRSRIRALIEHADLVIESSRPRAMRQWGIDVDDVVDGGTSWLSITAYGRSHEWVGFGDDVAAAAGLLVEETYPCGDAIADPLTGVAAAAAALDALDSDRARLIDVSMHAVVAETVGVVPEHHVFRKSRTWYVESASGTHRVREPEVRVAPGSAAVAGADNAEVFAWT